MVKVSLPSFGSGKSRSSRSGSVNEKVASSVSETVLNAPGSIAKGALAVGGVVGDGVGTILTTGISGVFSIGKGFRDFILKGTVVQLAVAVVLGTAFTNLIKAVTADWILPLIGAIFQGTQFTELYFTINYSQFNYGHFINELLVFILVCIILYLCVVVPLNKLRRAAFKHKAITKDCPCCYEEIILAATRCKFCCAEIELDEETQAILQMAEAALEAEEEQQHWLMRFLTRCVRSDGAVVEKDADGNLQLTSARAAGSPKAHLGGLQKATTFVARDKDADSLPMTTLPRATTFNGVHATTYASTTNSESSEGVSGKDQSAVIDMPSDADAVKGRK